MRRGFLILKNAAKLNVEPDADKQCNVRVASTASEHLFSSTNSESSAAGLRFSTVLQSTLEQDVSGNNELETILALNRTSRHCWHCDPYIRGASSICEGCSAVICPQHRHSKTGLCIDTEVRGVNSCYIQSTWTGWSCLSKTKLAKLECQRHGRE